MGPGRVRGNGMCLGYYRDCPLALPWSGHIDCCNAWNFKKIIFRFNELGFMLLMILYMYR